MHEDEQRYEAGPDSNLKASEGWWQLRAMAVWMVRAYQLAISPLLPPRCRYMPTCSEYAVMAIEKHGALRGLYYAIRRVIRCHPFKAGGYDPVP